jgi:hypothetical protein
MLGFRVVILRLGLVVFGEPYAGGVGVRQAHPPPPRPRLEGVTPPSKPPT